MNFFVVAVLLVHPFIKLFPQKHHKHLPNVAMITSSSWDMGVTIFVTIWKEKQPFKSYTWDITLCYTKDKVLQYH
jgi:hypothetical protein